MKLTKKNVESLEPTGTRYEVRDDELIAFSIRVGATGEKSFYLTYRAGKGRAGTGKENAGSHAAYQEKVREKRDPERDESGGRRDGQRQKFADWRA